MSLENSNNLLETQRLFQELQIYKIELELQNETLRQSQNQLENALKESYDLYESAPIAFFTLDRSSRILNSNSIAMQLLGEEFRKIVPLRFDLILHRNFLVPFWKFLDNIFLGASQQKCEVQFSNVGYNQKTFELSGNLNSEKKLVLLIARDITIEKRALETLEFEKIRAQENVIQKSEFVAMISHEIRTPMNGLLGMVDLLLETKPTAAQIGYLKTMNFCGSILLGLLNDILDFSKIESGKLEVESLPFSILKIVEELSKIVKPMASSKGLGFSVHYPLGCSWVGQGDPQRFRQVTLNLISNAIKFTKSGSISVHLESFENHIRLSVKDTGIGISPEGQEKLFQKFSQAPGNTFSEFGGTGLGLAISKELMAGMQGEIGLESTLGKGSKFWVTIPSSIVKSEFLFEANTSKSTTNKDSQPGPSLKGLLILSAEDNLGSQMVTAGFLNNWECIVSIANNGKEAVAMAKENHYSLILMDCQMPELNGFEATKEIRAWESESKNPPNRIPIIAMTAGAMRLDREMCLEAGMDDYLTKPVNPNELRKMVQLYCLGGSI